MLRPRDFVLCEESLPYITVVAPTRKLRFGSGIASPVPGTLCACSAAPPAFEVEGIVRMYLNVYVPALQRAGGVASFFRFHP